MQRASPRDLGQRLSTELCCPALSPALLRPVLFARMALAAMQLLHVVALADIADEASERPAQLPYHWDVLDRNPGPVALLMAPMAWQSQPRLPKLPKLAGVSARLRPLASVEAPSESGEGGSVVSVSKSVMEKVRALQAQAKDKDAPKPRESRHEEGAVPQLGSKAAELVAEAQQGGPTLAKAVEAALEPLFLTELRETRTRSMSWRKLMVKAEKSENAFLEDCDQLCRLSREAQQLQGSAAWHMEPEHQRLREVDTAAALAEERARAALVQRSTIEVIGRLQELERAIEPIEPWELCPAKSIPVDQV
eukprot:Skav235293  [mRNA]  locus=scaffold4363:56397:62900:- [translate_table: standard]